MASFHSCDRCKKEKVNTEFLRCEDLDLRGDYCRSCIGDLLEKINEWKKCRDHSTPKANNLLSRITGRKE